VSDASGFSEWLLQQRDAKSPNALERIGLAKRRVQSVLDRDTVACQKTLEQKISDQGPIDQRVDPHLVGLAIKDLLLTNRLKHREEGGEAWFANPATPDAKADAKIAQLAPLHKLISSGSFGNIVGDALEVIVFKCLDRLYEQQPRYAYHGSFKLSAGKHPKTGRYAKDRPPKSIGNRKTEKDPDFIQYGHDSGPLFIECKNRREWLYPGHGLIKSTIIGACDLGCTPVLIQRRLHYTTITNLLRPAGIIAHESYFQYYPTDKAEIAAAVKSRRSLGFTDVIATEEPHSRTIKFFNDTLPKIVDQMTERWNRNKNALLAYANGEIHLAQLYNAIGSPAAGKWQERDDEDTPPDDHDEHY
jgi:hypothetical protein